jgi:hypothetical protein
MGMRFEKIWVEQFRATRGIRRRFGAKSALDYLIGEKLIRFAEAAEQHPEFAKELPATALVSALSTLTAAIPDPEVLREESEAEWIDPAPAPAQ